MPSTSSSFSGFEGVIASLQTFQSELAANIQQKMNDQADQTLVDAQAVAPVSDIVDKDHMVDTGYVTYGELSAEVGFTADYSLFVEEGHLSRAGNPVAPQPFLYPAFQKNSQDFLDNLGGMLGE